MHYGTYTLECDNYFGGVNIICLGDIYQYMPVQDRALWTPIKSTLTACRCKPKELGKRFSQLAWKSFDKVVMLHEQKHMEGEPEYAEAVLRLRECKCLPRDVELFNCRVIKSHL